MFKYPVWCPENLYTWASLSLFFFFCLTKPSHIWKHAYNNKPCCTGKQISNVLEDQKEVAEVMLNWYEDIEMKAMRWSLAICRCELSANTEFTPPHPHPHPLGDGGLCHFSEHVYRRDLCQIVILAGNWCFRWQWFSSGGTWKLSI